MPETSVSESPASDNAAKAKRPGLAKPAPAAGALSIPTIAALVLSVVAIGLAVAGWFYPSSSQKFSAQQGQDSRANICNAQFVVRKATQVNTNAQNPVPGEVAGDIAVNTNARLSLFAGGSYLRQLLVANPATPADLAKAVGDMSDTLEALSINYLAGHEPGDDVQQPLRDQLLGEIDVLDNLCQ